MIELEKQLDKKRREEFQRRKEYERRREFELKVKEQQFKVKTSKILQEQDEKIEKKRESLDRFLQEKEYHIRG